MQSRLAVLALCAGVSLSAWGAQDNKTRENRPPLPAEVRASADALGMLRWNHDYKEDLDLINRVEWVASGTEYVPQSGKPWNEVKIKSLTFGASYRMPAARVDVVRVAADGREERSIHVFREQLAWNETEPGVGATAVPANAAAQRRQVVNLLPHGFMRAVIHADPKSVRVAQQGGKTVISVPVDGVVVKGTLGADKRPEKIEVPVTHPVLGKTVMEANYQDYKDSEGYEVFFPTRIVFKLGGRVTHDLTVSKHMTGPYLVWPVPQNTASANR